MNLDTFFLHKQDVIFAIVDIQERLAAVMGEKQKVINNCLHLISAASLLRIPLLVTEQYPKGLGPTVSEIKDALELYKPINKIAFNCCEETEFLDNIAVFWT